MSRPAEAEGRSRLSPGSLPHLSEALGVLEVGEGEQSKELAKLWVQMLNHPPTICVTLSKIKQLAQSNFVEKQNVLTLDRKSTSPLQSYHSGI